MSMSPTFFTPLRYPGGKAGLGSWVAHLMRHNRISGGKYVEPYAGGAGVALYLLLNRYVERIVINDVDPLIHSFWWAVLNDTEELIARIEEVPVNMDNWHQQKAVVAEPDAHDVTDIGFAAFFLNRTNRSGILRGGVIGGLEQEGTFKIDARFNKVDLVARIRRIARMAGRIELFNDDAAELIRRHAEEGDAKSLIYLDPPYYNKGSQLYRNFYSPGDHKEIADAIGQVRTPWMVTYDNCPEINELYTAHRSCEFSLVYSTNMTRQRATELLVYGNLELGRAPEMRRSVRPYPRGWDLVA